MKRQLIKVFVFAVASMAIMTLCAGATAREQADAYLKERGLSLGVVETGLNEDAGEGSGAAVSRPSISKNISEEFAGKTIYQLGEASFPYGEKMSDADFAEKLNDCYMKAYVEAASEVAFMISCQVESIEVCASENNGARRGMNVPNADGSPTAEAGRQFVFEELQTQYYKCLSKNAYAQIEPEEGGSAVGHQIKQSASFRVTGLSVEKKFTTMENSRYSVCLIVRFKGEKGNKILQGVSDGRFESIRPGKWSLAEWLNEREPQELLGVSDYFDRNGKFWAVGALACAAGKRPYGCKADFKARELASFSLGAEVVASKSAFCSNAGSLTESEIRLSADGLPYGAGYPEGLEVCLSAPFVEPVTGRRLTAAICCLPSGTSDFRRKQAGRQIEKERQKQYNAGKLTAIREHVKGKKDAR